MSGKKKRWSYLFLVVMIGITFFVLIRNFEFGDALRVLADADYRWVAMALLLMLLYIFLEGESIRVICRTLGARFSPFRGFVYSAVDIYFSAVTPSATGGAPLMMMYMYNDGVSYAKSSVVVLLNTMMYTVSMVVLAAVSLIICPFILMEDSLFFRICLGIGTCFSAGLITLCALGIFHTVWLRRAGNFLIRVGHRLRILRNPEKLSEKLNRVCEEYSVCAQVLRRHPDVGVKAFFLNLGQRAAYFCVAYMAYLALGFRGNAFFLLFGIQAVATMAVYSFPIPGAVGASEAMFLILYDRVYLEDERVAAMLLTRGISYYLTVLFCALLTMVYHICSTQRKKRQVVHLESIEAPPAQNERLIPADQPDTTDKTNSEDNTGKDLKS